MTATEALRRLTDAGIKNERATEKLMDAVYNIAHEIEQAAPVGLELPRGYKVITRSFNCNCEVKFLDGPHGYVDCRSIYIGGDFSARATPTTRECALSFAADVKDGLLLEITEVIEAHAKEANEAADGI